MDLNAGFGTRNSQPVTRNSTQPMENRCMSTSQSELDSLLSRIEEKYPIEIVPLAIGEKILKILQIKNYEQHFEELIEKKGAKFNELPFWAKVWDSSFILSLFLGKQPVQPWQTILEIGGGTGVVGIYAALCGHKVVVTDVVEDALLFARANALLNDCPGVEVRKLNWSRPDLTQRYEVIVGAEVIYDRESYPALVEFFHGALAPNGTIFLSKNAGLPTPTFFPELTRYFKFKHKTQRVFSGGEAQEITLYAIRRKEE